MRRFTLTREQFDRIVWVAYGLTTTDNESQLATSYEVGRKLRSVSMPTGESAGGGALDMRSLDSEEVEFRLENDEWSHLVNRIKKAIPQFTGAAHKLLHETLEKVKGAEQYEVGPEPVEDEEEGAA